MKKRQFLFAALAGTMSFSAAPLFAQQAKEAGAELLLVINASPFHVGKGGERVQRMADRVKATGLPLVYTHLVGGQDEIVFEGHSFALNADGSVAARAASFKEEMLLTHVTSAQAATETIANSVAYTVQQAHHDVQQTLNAMLAYAQTVREDSQITDVVNIGIGGSIPFIAELTEVFPAAQILVTGVEDPDSRAHSPNESVDLAMLQKAMVAEAIFLVSGNAKAGQ